MYIYIYVYIYIYTYHIHFFQHDFPIETSISFRGLPGKSTMSPVENRTSILLLDKEQVGEAKNRVLFGLSHDGSNTPQYRHWYCIWAM